MLKFSNPYPEIEEEGNFNSLLSQPVNLVLRGYEFYSDSSFSELGIEEILENNLPPVPVLPMKLQQIFDNLLRNAEQVIRVSKRSERLLTLISVPNKNLVPRFRSICSLSYNQINAEWRE